MNASWKPTFVLLTVVVASRVFGDDQPPPVVFDPRPPDAALAPLNDDERNASVVTLRYAVELGANISNWTVSGSTYQRYQMRYLAVDSTGVKSLSQHRFFGDESGVTIKNIQGQTIAPDGAIYPIDPDKDIRTLDATNAYGDDRGSYRTVNFPRVEPGAVMDLAWDVESKGLPTLETVSLEGDYPVRELQFKSQGQLIGAGKSLWLGTGQYFWVPFFLSRIPPNVTARLSSHMDLELTAHNLRSSKWEPYAPPAMRTNATLGVLPMSFAGSTWQSHVFLFGDNPPFPPAHGNDALWIDGELKDEYALTKLDALGLQIVPLPARSNQSLDFFQSGLRGLSNEYRVFTGKTKLAETREQLETIAPPDLAWQERVDRLFEHARATVKIDPFGRQERTLDQLLEKGIGDDTSLLYYMKYLMTTADIPNSLVMAFSRTGPPFLPLFRTWSPFTRSLFLEVGPLGGPRRYLEPGDYFAGNRSFGDSYLGGILLRDAGPKTDWVVDRVPLDTPVSEKTTIAFHATLEPSGASTPLHVTAEFFDSASNRLHWVLGYPKKDSDPVKLADKRKGFIRQVLAYWSAATIPDSAEVPVPDPLADPTGPLRVEADVPWTPDVQTLGTQLILPPLPPLRFFHNDFVAEERQHPLWLRGGDFDISATWRIPSGYHIADTAPKTATGPGGLEYRLSRSADPAAQTVTTRVVIHQPYLLPATDYAQTRAFFESLQRDTTQPVLLEH